MRRDWFPIVLALWLSLWGAGCGGGGDGAPQDEPRAGLNRSQYTLASNARLIAPDSGVVLEAQDARTMVLSGAVPNLAPGSILVSQLGRGALRHVDGVRRDGDRWILTTSQAGLAEAFESMDFRFDRLLGRETFGDLQSQVPGIELRWDDRGASRAEGGGGLTVDFGDGFSAGGSVVVRGDGYLRLNPIFDLQIGRPAGGILPRILLFEVGIVPEVGSSMEVEATAEGEVSKEFTILDREFAPVAVGPLVFVPSLEIKLKLGAGAEAEMAAMAEAQAAGRAWGRWTYGGGWQSKNGLTFTKRAGVTSAKGGFGASASLEVEVSFMLYGIVGPNASIGPEVGLAGELQNVGEECGVHATATAGLGGSLGIGAGLEDVPILGALVDVEFSLFELPFTIAEVEFFNRHLPFPGTTLTVTDNGDAADDIFEVLVDGRSLGLTPLGGAREWPLCPLDPGRHRLTLRAVEAGPPRDPATFGASLTRGAAFVAVGGRTTTTATGGIQQDQTLTIDFVVPDVGGGRAAPPAMPRNPIAEASR